MSNREIKFRSFDNENKSMNYDIDLNIAKYNGDTVMQFTGLLDKNGKEIYEGDIILIELPERMPMDDKMEVVFYNGCFVLKGWVLMSADHHHFQSMMRYISVIGTIHENPELIKPTTKD